MKPGEIPAIDPADWDHYSTHFVLFTGKCGVGKTTIASATAVALAYSGRQVPGLGAVLSTMYRRLP